MGRLLAYAKIDEIIKLIRASEDQPEAKENLQKKYKFTERQAEDIVNLRLGPAHQARRHQAERRAQGARGRPQGPEDAARRREGAEEARRAGAQRGCEEIRRRAAHPDQDRRARAGRAHGGRGADHGDPVAARAGSARAPATASISTSFTFKDGDALLQTLECKTTDAVIGALRLGQELHHRGGRDPERPRRRRAGQHAGQFVLRRHRVDALGRPRPAPAHEQLRGPGLHLQARRPRHQDAPGQGLHEGGRGRPRPAARLDQAGNLSRRCLPIRACLSSRWTSCPSGRTAASAFSSLPCPRARSSPRWLTTDGKSLVVSGIKRKNRAVETMDAKQLAEHIGKRAQRGKLAGRRIPPRSAGGTDGLNRGFPGRSRRSPSFSTRSFYAPIRARCRGAAAGALPPRRSRPSAIRGARAGRARATPAARSRSRRSRR